MDIRDQNGKSVNIAFLEKPEQDLAQKYIKENDIVFELGARYGSVSCIINSKLKCKTNQVVVEPDERVWDALERNKIANNCEFHIIKGFVSAKKLALTNLDNYYGGYGATFIEQVESTIPCYTMDEIKEKYNLKFNVLVADCEGALYYILQDFPKMLNDIKTIIMENDYKDINHKLKVDEILKANQFLRKFVKAGGWGPCSEFFYEVWKKSDSK